MTVLKHYQPDHPALKEPIAATEESALPPVVAPADVLPPNPIIAPRKPTFNLSLVSLTNV